MSNGERARLQSRVPAEQWERIRKELPVLEDESDAEALRFIIQDWLRMRQMYEPKRISADDSGE
jgi:hypothetical protein